jgi:hypothetical protein
MQSMFTLLRVTRPTLAWVESRTPRRFGLSRVINAVQVRVRGDRYVPRSGTRSGSGSAPAARELDRARLAAVLMVGAPLASMAQVQSTPSWNSSNFETTADVSSSTCS